MVAPDLLNTVLSLPLADRFDLLRQLQDNLRSEPSASSLSDAHRRILESRLEEFEADPTAGSSWDEVKARLTQSLGRP